MLTNPLRRRNARRLKVDDDRVRRDRILDLEHVLMHGDPGQLAFQISEIAGDRIYTRNGVSVNRGDTVIDVGANFGVSAAHFALQCGAGQVHSLEPVLETFEVLRRNVAAIPACTPHPIGLAAEAGTAEMTSYAGGDSVLSSLYADPARSREMLATAGHNLGLSRAEAEEMAERRCAPRPVECRFTTLSAFLRSEGIEQVDLLKIDVERAELEVLLGIEPPDWPRIRQIAAEVHDERILASIEEMLAGHSFRTVVEQDPNLAGTPIRLLYATH